MTATITTGGGDSYDIGANFVDSVTGKTACRGNFELNDGRARRFRSSLSLERTEGAIRASAAKEGRELRQFHGQAVIE